MTLFTKICLSNLILTILFTWIKKLLSKIVSQTHNQFFLLFNDDSVTQV